MEDKDEELFQAAWEAWMSMIEAYEFKWSTKSLCLFMLKYGRDND